MVEVFLCRRFQIPAIFDGLQDLAVLRIVLPAGPLLVEPVRLVLILGVVVRKDLLDCLLLRHGPGGDGVLEILLLLRVLRVLDLLVHVVDPLLRALRIHLRLLRIPGKDLIIILCLRLIADIIGLQQQHLVIVLLQLPRRLDERIGLPLVLASLGHSLIGGGLLRGQRLEPALHPALCLFRRRLSEQQRLCPALCPVGCVAIVHGILQNVAPLVVDRVAAAASHRRRALIRLADLPAAERRRKIQARLQKFVSDGLCLLRRRHVLVLCQQRLLDVSEVRDGRRHGDPAAVNVQPQRLIHAEDRQRLRARELRNDVPLKVLDRLIRARLLFREVPFPGYRRLHRVRQLIPREISDRIIDDIQRIQRRAPSHNALVELIVDPRADKEFEHGLGQCRHALLPLLLRHILEDPAELIVDLQLELREQLHQRVPRGIQRRRRAFAAVCHDAGRKLVCLLHRARLAHAPPQILVIPRADHAPRRERVDGFHQPACTGGDFIHCAHGQPPVAAAVVDERRRRIQPVRRLVVFQRIPHAAQHVCRRHLAPCLRDRNEVCERRTHVGRDHVRAHAGLKLLHYVVELPPHELFHAPVAPRLLSRQQVRVFVQLIHKVRKPIPSVLRQVCNLLVGFVRV